MSDLPWNRFSFAGLFRSASFIPETHVLTLREPIAGVERGEETELKLVVCGIALPDRRGGLLTAQFHYVEKDGSIRSSDLYEIRPTTLFCAMIVDVKISPKADTISVCLEVVDVDGVFGEPNDQLVRSLVPVLATEPRP